MSNSQLYGIESFVMQLQRILAAISFFPYTPQYHRSIQGAAEQLPSNFDSLVLFGTSA
jgi:hypothetical protein